MTLAFLRRCLPLAALCLPLRAQATLSLREAVTQALASHPLLAAQNFRVESASELALQAGLRPNPRLIFQQENARPPSRTPFQLWRDTDSFAMLSQVVEAPGKRDRRVDLADATRRQAEIERESQRFLIASRVRQAYWAAVGAQHLRDRVKEEVSGFDRVVDYHTARVREGAMAEGDLIRVLLERDRLALAVSSAGLDARRAEIALQREMGQADFPDLLLTEPLTVAEPPAEVDRQWEQVMRRRPEAQLAQLAVERARANLRLQQVQARPDHEVLLGVKRTQGLNTLVAGWQFNLPIANRGQGLIGSAAAEVRVAEANAAAFDALARAEVQSALADVNIRRRSLALLEPVRTRAAESVHIAEAAYRLGGTDLLRLLEAQRLRLEAETQHLRALSDYRQSLAGLETALGVVP